MLPGPYETVPLTDDDKDFLLTIYDKRRRLLFVVYVILIAMALCFSFRGLDYRTRYSPKVNHWEDEEDSKYISRFWMWTINLTFLELPVVGTGLYFLFHRVLPFKKDADSGVKEKVPYRIIRKEYYEATRQYFVGFDDVNYEHHEVDADTFNKCNEGDVMYIYRGAKSKFVFENNGRFTLM